MTGTLADTLVCVWLDPNLAAQLIDIAQHEESEVSEEIQRRVLQGLRDAGQLADRFS